MFHIWINKNQWPRSQKIVKTGAQLATEIMNCSCVKSYGGPKMFFWPWATRIVMLGNPELSTAAA